MDFVSFLPTEMSLKIFSYLNINDIVNSSTVSPSWYNVTNTNFIWDQLHDKDLPLKEVNDTSDLDWLYQTPCKWKLQYLNHKKVIHNWRDQRYKKYEINGRWASKSAYDGKTLVIHNFQDKWEYVYTNSHKCLHVHIPDQYLEVYRVEESRIVHIQTLCCNEYTPDTLPVCATNTTYIVVSYRDFLLIYHSIDNHYEVSHMLYIDSLHHKLRFTANRSEIDTIIKEKKYSKYRRLRLMCMLGNTLYVCIKDIVGKNTIRIDTIFAWNLNEMSSMLEMKITLQQFLHDNERIYICLNDRINVYDANARECFSVRTQWNIYKIQINNRLLLAIRDLDNDVVICAWNKKRGNILYNKGMPVSTNSRLHPKNNMIIDIKFDRNSEITEVFACNIQDNTIIWRTYGNIACSYALSADKCLLFCNYELKHNWWSKYDTRRDNWLDGMYYFSNYNVFASYDLIIYSKNNKLIVHKYS